MSDCSSINRKLHIHTIMHNLKKQQVHQFPKYDPGQQSSENTDPGSQNRLYCHHPRNMAFFHSQNIIYADLFFPSFDQEAVRIEQENHSKYDDHTSCILQTYLQSIHRHSFSLAQRIYHIEHHNGKNCSDNIRHICFPVVFQICDCKFFIHKTIHHSHLLPPELLRYLQSSGTSLHS